MNRTEERKSATFGPNAVTSGFWIRKHVTAINSDAKAEIVVEPGVLTEGVVDYRAVALVRDGPLVIGGWVTSADPEGDSTVVSIRSGAELFDAYSTAGVIANTTPFEIAYTVARLAGLTPERIDIPDLRLVIDRFHVAMPLRDWELGGDLRLGEVYFTADLERMKSALPFKAAEDLVETFLATGVWAVARVTADNMVDAEAAGVRLIDSALDRIALEAQYSLARSPSGELPSYARSDLFADPTALRLALVRGVATPRVSLRSLDASSRGRETRRRRIGLEAPEIGESAASSREGSPPAPLSCPTDRSTSHAAPSTSPTGPSISLG